LIQSAGDLKVGTHSMLEALGLTDIDHPLFGILKQVDARLVRENFELFFQHRVIISCSYAVVQ